MADDDKKPGEDLVWVEDGEVYVDESVVLDDDADKALKELAEQLEGELEVQGFAEGTGGIDLPPISVKTPISRDPVAIDLPPINPMINIMVGMMMT